MKSLKKTLSLVLVLVMVLGMFGAASAFTDDATIQYKEAVDVMTGIGAIAGFPDGSFGPTKTITRAEAAKMVAYAILGADVASKLTGVTSSFSDVPANPYGWAIPSIEYLVKAGIVSGVGGGKFNPAGEISALEVAKMLLCAIGYGANDEYVGEGWSLAVAIDANKMGIFDGRAANANELDKPASREEVALYCFNALTNSKATQVEYSPLLGTYVGKGSLFGGPGETIGTEVYNLTPVTGTTTVDAFGRPSKLWKTGFPTATKTIASLSTAPIYSTTASAKKAAVELAIKNAGGDISGTIAVYENGTKNAATTWAAYFAGDDANAGGVSLEVFADADGKVNVVVVVKTYLAVVSATPAKDNASTTTVDERSLTFNDTTLSTVNNVAGYLAYPAKHPTGKIVAKGFDAAYTALSSAYAAAPASAMALVTPVDTSVGKDGSSYEIAEIALPTVKELTPSAVVSSVGFTADGTTYYFSATAASRLTTVTYGTAYNVVFDGNGLVMAAMPVTATSSYAVVVRNVAETDAWGVKTPKAELLLEDGTTITSYYTFDGTADADKFFSDDDGFVGPQTGMIVTYEPTAKTGVVKLTHLVAYSSTNNTNLTIKTGVATFTFGAVTDNIANANTIFLVKTTSPAGDTYTAYKGIANVPSYAIANGTVKGAVYAKTGKTANVVYLDNPGTPSSGGGSVIMVAVPANAPVITDASGSYKLVNAVVDGAVTQIKVATATTTGIYAGSTVTNGIYTLSSPAQNGASGAYAAGNMTFTGGTAAGTYAFTSTAVAYTYNAATGVITASSPSSIGWPSATSFFTLNANNQITALFVLEA